MNRILYTISMIAFIAVFTSCEKDDFDTVDNNTVMTTSTRSINEDYISNPTELSLYTYAQPSMNEYFRLTKPCEVTLNVSFNRGLNSWYDLDGTSGSHAKIISLSGSSIGEVINIELTNIISSPYPSSTYVEGSVSVILTEGLYVFNVSFTTELGTQVGFSGLHGSTDATATFDYQFYFHH